MSNIAFPYQVGPVLSWPVAELAVRSWLIANIPGVNVRTETDATFGTSSPSPSMVLPLVLVEQVPGGAIDPEDIDSLVTVDIQCFAVDRAGAWSLFGQVNPWMLRLIGQSTSAGFVDDVELSNGGGVVNYNNPDVRRVVATYKLTTRPQ